MTVGESEWSRRSILGGVAASMAATAGCLGSAAQQTPAAGDWPQRGYDSGATFYKEAGSPPVEDAGVAWDAEVDNSLYAVIDHRWHDDWRWNHYRDLTYQRHIGTLAYRYARTPIVVVGEQAYLSGKGSTVVDTTDGTAVEHSRPDERVLVGAARTDAYRDGMLVGTGVGDGADCRDRCVVIRGFQPSTEDRAWFAGPRRWTAGAPKDFPATAVAGRIEDGTIVTVVPDSEPPFRIVEIDADDGRIEWENTISHGVHRLRVENGLAYASVLSEESGTMTILDGSSVRQRVAIESTDLLEAVRDGVAYLRDFRTEAAAPSIKAVDAESGEVRRLLDGSTVAERITGSPTGVGDLVVGPDRLFASVHTETGSDPAVLALDRSDGTIEWVRQLPGRLRLTGTDDALYVAGPREPGPQAYAFDPVSGDRLWSVELPSRPSFGLGAYRPVVADSKVLVPLDGVLVALEEP
jgi:outer membrane protein assembly factor BamB